MTLVDETAFTPHARPGWQAWNSYSPEVEFCRFVGMLQRMLQPNVIVETGVGAGKVTEQFDLNGRVAWLGFESDDQWRPAAAQRTDTPTVEQIASADMAIFDSDPAFRLPEIKVWAEHGKTGSVAVVHDAGNRHPVGWDTHHKIRRACEDADQPGVFLKNPRGGWLAIHQ